jgi:uncharacterized repeat protein (TIGR03803 family)
MLRNETCIDIRRKLNFIIGASDSVCLAAIAAPVRAQTFRILSTFTGASGAYPYGGLMQDSAGTLYGTTYSGGASSAGTMFAVIYGAEPVLHSFNGSDESIPKAGLIRDQSGFLYGTTQEGGAYGLGAVFKLSNAGSLTTLHSFAGGSSDGAAPTHPGALAGTKSFQIAFYLGYECLKLRLIS